MAADRPETGELVTKASSAQHDAATGTVALTTIFEVGAQGPPPGRWVRTDRLRLDRRRRARGVRRGRGPQRRDCWQAATISARSDPGRTGSSSSGRRTTAERAGLGPPGGCRRGPSWYRRVPCPVTDQTRLLIVEDVPQVAQYIRGLLNTQQHVQAARRPERRQQGDGPDRPAPSGRDPRRFTAPGTDQGTRSSSNRSRRPGWASRSSS